MKKKNKCEKNKTNVCLRGFVIVFVSMQCYFWFMLKDFAKFNWPLIVLVYVNTCPRNVLIYDRLYCTNNVVIQPCQMVDGLD